MDLRLYGRVLWRFRFLMALGLNLAVILAALSYYNVSFDGGLELTPRKQEIWQAEATLFLTQPGFPAGRTEQPLVLKRVGDETTAVPKYSEPGRFTSLAALYARLANSDDVKRRVERHPAAARGDYRAVPTADTTYGAVTALPMMSIFGSAPTPAEATSITGVATRTFVEYFREQQDAANIPTDQRLRLEVLNDAGQTVLLDPRKKTLPIVVFLAMTFAILALAFVLENARPRTMVAPPEAEELPASEIRRLA